MSPVAPITTIGSMFFKLVVFGAVSTLFSPLTGNEKHFLMMESCLIVKGAATYVNFECRTTPTGLKIGRDLREFQSGSRLGAGFVSFKLDKAVRRFNEVRAAVGVFFEQRPIEIVRQDCLREAE